MYRVQIHLPKINKPQFESDCQQLPVKIVPEIFSDEPLSSTTTDPLVIVSLLLSSSTLVLNIFNILKSYREQKTYKIEVVKNGVKISFDSKTPVEEINQKLRELGAGDDEQ